MPKRIQWTAVAQRPYTKSILRAIKSSGDFGAASEKEVGELAARLAQTMPATSRNEFIAKLSLGEKMSATSWLQVFEHEKIEAGLNAFYNVFGFIGPSPDWETLSKERKKIGDDTVIRYLLSNAIVACPTPILGLQGANFLFLLHYENPGTGAWDGLYIADKLRKEIKSDKKYTRNLVDSTVREVIDHFNKQNGSPRYEKSKEEEIIKEFTELFMMVRG